MRQRGLPHAAGSRDVLRHPLCRVGSHAGRKAPEEQARRRL